MKVLFSTGEISGENYAVKLKKAMEEKNNDIEFIGIGSLALEDHGIRVIGDLSPYSTVGFTDVLKNFSALYSSLQTIRRAIKKEQPQLVIFIDSPGLNLRLIPHVKKLKIKSAYLFPPQVWAWKKNRLKLLRLVNKIIVGFPFEETFYKEHNIKAKFFGHPLIDIVKINEEYMNKLREKFGEEKRFIGVFPGSRISEINNHIPVLGKVLENISAKFPDIFYLISSPTQEFAHFLEDGFENYIFSYEIINKHPYEVMGLSEFILTSSGTATLEAAILGIPEIIFYKMNILNWLFAKFFVKVDYIGLPNLVYGKLVVPELVQWDFNPYSLEYLMIKFIVDPKITERIVTKLANIRDMLGENGAIDRIGDELLSMVV